MGDITMKSPRIITTLGLLLAIGWMLLRFGSQQTMGQASVIPAANSLVDAAQHEYDATVAAYQSGTVKSIDLLYLWSRRWMQAVIDASASPQDRNKAYQDHHDRMKLLNAQVSALVQTGAAGGEADKYAATQYYLAQADQWLANPPITPVYP
jgi:hypothetical protein